MEIRGFDITKLAVLNIVAEDSENELANALTAQGFNLFRLQGKEISGKQDFFAGLSQQLLQNEPVGSWSGVEDLLSHLLWTNGTGNKTALLWNGVDQMLHGGLMDLITCSDVLTSLSRKFYKENRVHINFLLGNGDNFPAPLNLVG